MRASNAPTCLLSAGWLMCSASRATEMAQFDKGQKRLQQFQFHSTKLPDRSKLSFYELIGEASRCQTAVPR